MKKNVKILLPCVLATLLLVAVIVVYFVVVHSGDKTFEMYSFDETQKLTFEYTSNITNVSEIPFGISIRFNDRQKFVEQMTENAAFLTRKEYEDFTAYIFYDKGYYYILDVEDTYAYLRNSVGRCNGSFCFPFVTLNEVIHNEDTLSYARIDDHVYSTAKNKTYNGYASLKNYYLTTNAAYYRFDDDNETIYLKLYQYDAAEIWDDGRVSQDYLVTLLCDENGVTFRFPDLSEM